MCQLSRRTRVKGKVYGYHLRNAFRLNAQDLSPIDVKTSFLDFEQPIAELEQKIEELRFVQDD